MAPATRKSRAANHSTGVNDRAPLRLRLRTASHRAGTSAADRDRWIACHHHGGRALRQSLLVDRRLDSATTWAAATALTAGAEVVSGAKVYRVGTSGTPGATAPTPASGTVTLDGIACQFLSTAQYTVETSSKFRLDVSGITTGPALLGVIKHRDAKPLSISIDIGLSQADNLDASRIVFSMPTGYRLVAAPREPAPSRFYTGGTIAQTFLPGTVVAFGTPVGPGRVGAHLVLGPRSNRCSVEAFAPAEIACP